AMEPHRLCPACGERRACTLHRRPARRILRCTCGLVFIDPLPSEAEVAARESEAFRGELLAETRAMFDAYGRGYRDDDPVVRAFGRHLATLGRLAAGRRLLDVGVGTGLLVHLARQAGWDATGVDICAGAAGPLRPTLRAEPLPVLPAACARGAGARGGLHARRARAGEVVPRAVRIVAAGARGAGGATRRGPGGGDGVAAGAVRAAGVT